MSGLKRICGRRRRDSGGRNEYLLAYMVRYLGNIPLAHVAVELVGAVEHCEERRRVSGLENNGSDWQWQRRQVRCGRKKNVVLTVLSCIRHLSDIPLAHVAVKLVGVVRTLRGEKARVSGLERMWKATTRQGGRNEYLL